MRLPFSIEEFLEVFRRYNETVWPIHLVAYGVAVFGLAAMLAGWSGARMFLLASLAFLWAWTGASYHLVFFSKINGAAWGFGVLFLIQAVLFVGSMAFGKSDLPPALPSRVLGWAIVLYAMVGYPALSGLSGHFFPSAPMFGVTPCPLDIFTLGVLLLLYRRVPLALVAIPLLWALVATFAAMQLGMVEDYGLTLSALVTVGVMLSAHAAVRHSKSSGPAPAV